MELRVDLSKDLHRVRIPLDYSTALHAQIAEQRGSGCAEAEYRIFNDGLARANSSEEIVEVVVAVAVSIGRDKLLDGDGGRPGRMRRRILLVITRQRICFCIASVKVPVVRPGSFSRGVRLTLT